MRRLRRTVNRATAMAAINAVMVACLAALYLNDNLLCRIVWYLGVSMMPIVVYQSARWHRCSLDYKQWVGSALTTDPSTLAKRINRVRLYALRLMAIMLLQMSLCGVAMVLVIRLSYGSLGEAVVASLLVMLLVLAALIALFRASQSGDCVRTCDRHLSAMTGIGGHYLRTIYEAWTLSAFEGGDSSGKE
ncbi:MAG: hypothetical protein Q4C83_00405 [Candidatus Saccharibacteria bacterium]|nr:hypothetical protein [Candidatus Saccharibacteria bacterium]